MGQHPVYNRVIKSKGILRGKQRFQCKSCGRKFTYDTKQLTSNSHQPMESWIVVLEDTLSLASLDSTAEKIGVCHTTAFRIVIHPFSFGSGTLMIKDFSSMLNLFYSTLGWVRLNPPQHLL